MTNSQIAQTILQIAEILDLLGEDRFRVIAYERAASTVRMLGEDLSGIYKHGGIKELEDIEGVGESIALKIEELLKTGKLKYLEDLKKKVPASEITFLQIPGVGPKTAVKLVKELKVKTIEQLGKKLQSKQAAKYFQEKTRQNILRGIEILKRMGTRKLLTFAMPIAQDIVLALKKRPEVLQADAVGSLRRWKETVGD
ncbi:MAG: DNA polymerase III, partial [Candidatus Nealsonbacteria bacterium CG07_land_8_20_14_0_80_40_10]